MSLADAVPFIVASWTLDESSGDRTSNESIVLTDNNTVGSTTGKFSVAAAFVRAANEFLNKADNTTLSAGDIKFEIRCWVRLTSKPAENMEIVCKTSGSGEYELIWRTASDRFRFSVYGSTAFGDAGHVDANNFGAPSTATWYLIHAWHDSVNDEIGIAVNAGTADTTAHTAGILDGTSDFRLGGNGFDNFLDGDIDDLVILKDYILSSAERTADYNGGDGVTFDNWDEVFAVGGGLGGSFPIKRFYRPAAFMPGNAR